MCSTSRRLSTSVDSRLRGPTAQSLGACVKLNRDSRIQIEHRDRLLLHIFQHQVHHRGQAHAMLSGTSVKPPQLDEFFSVGESPLAAPLAGQDSRGALTVPNKPVLLGQPVFLRWSTRTSRHN